MLTLHALELCIEMSQAGSLVCPGLLALLVIILFDVRVRAFVCTRN